MNAKGGKDSEEFEKWIFTQILSCYPSAKHKAVLHVMMKNNSVSGHFIKSTDSISYSIDYNCYVHNLRTVLV